MAIPIIDIFAGPGGLGEGFSAVTDNNNKRAFKIVLSIEKDINAHQTLQLRSFFRQFEIGMVPKDYYEFVKGNITLEELYNKWPKEYINAKNEAWNIELGDSKNSESSENVDAKIVSALENSKNWLLIGGPPCQAYSVVGRSRRQEKLLDEKTDERVGLYKQYLRILAVHNPSVFIMENVKGLLSAETKDSPIFSKILKDLSDPVKVYITEFGNENKKLDCPGYKIYSLVADCKAFDLEGNPTYDQKDYIIKSENYGVPQTRHRVILLGIRKTLNVLPNTIKARKKIPISKVLNGLPKLRGGLSKTEDSNEAWKKTINEILTKDLLAGAAAQVKDEILRELKHLRQPRLQTGGEYIPQKTINIKYENEWFLDRNLDGVCNHASRGHMASDLHRYFFAACYAKIQKASPKLENFPINLLPEHKNVKEGIDDKKFADRFRVQLWNKPAKTITSHISKDGHYYIHPDPTQCRSLTVREAARIQTFPDNYFFCGPRTSQFIQVGNAVPPLLAFTIAKIISNLI